MSKGMLGPRLSTIIDLLGRFILRFESKLVLFMREPYDLSPQLGRGTHPVVRATLTNPCLADPVIFLPAFVLLSGVMKLFALGTNVTVRLRVVTKMTLAKPATRLARSLIP